MAVSRYSLPLVALAALLAAPHQEYRQRREALRKSLDDSVLVLFGADEDEAGDLHNVFSQEPNFYYLTGWTEPGAILLMDSRGEILLLPGHNQKRELWTGAKSAPGDPGIGERTGFAAVLNTESLETQLFRMLESSRGVYTVESHPATSKLRSQVAMRTITDAKPLLAALRMKKSRQEIEIIQHAVDVSVEAQLAAWKRVRPGTFEYQVAATLTAAWLERGCERATYPPVVASGPNSAVLHYFQNKRRMDSGELVILDAAAQCAMYGADMTRTLPVTGKFTPRQRELYEAVLGAAKAAIAAVKPGMTLGRSSPNSLYRIAVDYLNSHGRPVNGKRLGEYFTHGLSHHVGLEVHDLDISGAELREGMVITIEPGIYIPEENIGVRIEEMVLVTSNGTKVLSSGLPRDPADIERAMAR